jgi:putative flippase GtrA
MMTKLKIALLYSLFAIISIVANLLAQDITVRVYHLKYQIALSVIVGTAVGLLIKYVLDKKYIFRFSANSLAHDSSLFVMYTAMGVVATLIFWGFEFTFEYLFHTKFMRYLGAVIGLSIGYFIKYNLDKRFVFNEKELKL